MRDRLRRASVFLVFGLVAWEPLVSIILAAKHHLLLKLHGADLLLYAYSVWATESSALSPHSIELHQVAGIAAIICLVPAVWMLVSDPNQHLREAREGEVIPNPRRANSSGLGSAEWLPMVLAERRFPGPQRKYGGVVIGEAYRVDQDKSIPKEFGYPVAFASKKPKTWGRGGKANLLIDPCIEGSTHGTIISPSGGGKTVGFTIPTLLYWTGSAVVFDPPDTVRPMVTRARKAMGHKVYHIAPGKQGMNILAWIDINSPMAEPDVLEVLDWVCGPTSGKEGKEENDFTIAGRMVLAAVLADMLWDPTLPKAKKNLREFRQRVTISEKLLKRKLQDISVESVSPLARDNARSFFETYEKTFSGAAFHASIDSSCLGVRVWVDMLSNPDVDPDDIVRRPTTVFITIPMDHLAKQQALGRACVGVFQSALRRAQGKVFTERVLFLYEEARFLGRLAGLATMMVADRKFGATVVTVWQSEADIKSIWGTNASIFSANSSWTLYAAIDDEDTAKKVSSLVGRHTILTRTKGENRPAGSLVFGATSSNDGLSESGQPLISPEDVRLMRGDEQIVLIRSHRALRCGRALYYRRDDMDTRVDADRLVNA